MGLWSNPPSTLLIPDKRIILVQFFSLADYFLWLEIAFWVWACQTTGTMASRCDCPQCTGDPGGLEDSNWLKVYCLVYLQLWETDLTENGHTDSQTDRTPTRDVLASKATEKGRIADWEVRGEVMKTFVLLTAVLLFHAGHDWQSPSSTSSTLSWWFIVGHWSSRSAQHTRATYTFLLWRPDQTKPSITYSQYLTHRFSGWLVRGISSKHT